LCILSENIVFILYSSPSCNTLSRVWLMPRNAAVQYLFFQCVMYDVGYTVDLFNSSVFLSETEMVIRYNPFLL
jgi:hypothetical protein